MYRLAFIVSCTLIFASLSVEPAFAQDDRAEREAYLEEIISLQEDPPSDDYVTYHDETWLDWVERTGELPPNFTETPSQPLLPDLLTIDQNGERHEISDRESWQQQREYIAEQVKHLLSGTFPDPPEAVRAEILESRTENGVSLETVELSWGDDERARMTAEIITPPGDGPFPVFMTQWNHRGWAQIAVRRGYMAVIYAGADSRDDTEPYLAMHPDHDWTTLMRRAWGAFRVLDYLESLPAADMERIGITGHSRNAKQAVLAAAFDQRIDAVISSSGGTGGEIPYRHSDHRHANEDIEFLVSRRTHWLHPRLRFYAGREHKLPIDQHSLLALIAPNGLLLSSSIREGKAGGDPWAIEQMYRSLTGVYDMLDAPDALGVRFRDGDHGVSARDIEGYLDWLDIQFDRSDDTWQNNLSFNYSFERWQEISGEAIQPEQLPDSLAPLALRDVRADGSPSTREEWEGTRSAIQSRLQWMLGEEPPGVKADPIRRLSGRQDYISQLIDRPEVENGASRNIAPYNALGDYLYGTLYYPTNEDGQMQTREEGTLPVVVFLHKYANTGFDDRLSDLFESYLDAGFAVLAMDLVGYGQRIEEGTTFYERYPNWSMMGKMVTDTRAAIDALESLEQFSDEEIFLSGYALGGTVSLITASLDDRVAGTAVSSAFTPLRDASEDVEGLHAYSHLYGLMPRLGFFENDPAILPVDFPEIISAAAPSPTLVIAPTLDRHADHEQVQRSIQDAGAVYELFNADDMLSLHTPHDINRFSVEQQDAMVTWLRELID